MFMCVVLRPKHACGLKSCEKNTMMQTLTNLVVWIILLLFYHFDLTFFFVTLLHCYIKCHRTHFEREIKTHSHGYNTILSEARRQCKQSTSKKIIPSHSFKWQAMPTIMFSICAVSKHEFFPSLCANVLKSMLHTETSFNTLGIILGPQLLGPFFMRPNIIISLLCFNQCAH